MADKPIKTIVEAKEPSYKREIREEAERAKLLPATQDVLRVYNSVTISNVLWSRRRHALRNSWPELFELLERASGRDINGGIIPFDENFHVMSADGPHDKWDDDPDFKFSVS